MSTVINLDDARTRGIDLPADDGNAQDILDEQESWLARRIGPLTGERTERFYVGVARREIRRVLALRRFTDEVTILDGTATVATSNYRLHDGAWVVREYPTVSPWWNGPYVAITYTPNDEGDVRRVLYGLVALEAQPVGPYESEHIGSYSYTRRGQGGGGVGAAKRALADSILPKRDALVAIYASRPVAYGDPVINRAEPEPEYL